MKQILIRLSTIFFAILALASVYFFIYYYNNQDISNVKIEGYVLDSINSQPLKNVKVTVTNDRYENDNGHRNYDEYLGQDKIQVRTNNEGYYSITFKKSAYVYIYLKKEGYQSLEEKGRQAQKLLTFKTSMNKISPR